MPSARSMEPTRAELEFLAKLGKWAEPDVTRMSRADLQGTVDPDLTRGPLPRWCVPSALGSR